ncbi:MAG: SPFH domain-containing protein [Sphingobacteriia bacterium]|nr:SPFH domain-containing protein [Sphingobacteriia bacterium]
MNFKKSYSGIQSFFLIMAIAFFAIYLLIANTSHGGQAGIGFWVGLLLLPLDFFLFKGLVAIEPNYAVVLTFFGKYVGTVSNNGLRFINPLYSKLKVSLRIQSLESEILKVNDKLGNPIEIGAIVVWQIEDTYKAVFEVKNFADYLKNQAEAAVRHIASVYPYDTFEDEGAEITLRDGADKVIKVLEKELGNRFFAAGVKVVEARLSHLAYAPEIAGAMLQRQQATAIVSARSKIVEGAVGMVEMALDMLSKKEIVVLDDEKKAAMVSNLMVVLCGEKSASPVLNTGTLYQ